MIPTTVEMLQAWDAQRERSQQREMGMSALGSCRRAAGYTLAGTEPEHSGGSIQATLGTAIHETAEQAARQQLPGALVENIEVTFAGLKGHPDLYSDGIVRDIKTTGRSSTLESWKIKGPPRRHVWQVHAYGAGLILAGHEVTTVQIDYVARDTGDTWLYESPFYIGTVREAVSWLTTVRETPLDFLARDYRPESANCRNCQFFKRCWAGYAVPGRDLRSALFIDEPDANLWIKRLEDARERKAAAEADEKDAKGALDAIRPVDYGTIDVEVPGVDKVIRFQVQKGRRRLDSEAVKQDYAAVGAEPPMVTGDPVTKITFLAKENGAADPAATA